MKKRFRIVAGLKMGLALQLSLLTLTACDGRLLPLQTGASGQKPVATGKDPNLSGNIPTQLGNLSGNIPTQLGQLSDQDPDQPVIVGQVYGPDQARQVPVYQVVQHGLSETEVRNLGAAFQVPLQQEADGSVSYLDPQRFQHVPMLSRKLFRTQAASLQPAQDGTQDSTDKVVASPTPQPSPSTSQEKGGTLEYLASDLLVAEPSATPVAAGNEDGQTTSAEYFDFAALKQIQALDSEKALYRIQTGLNRAGLAVEGKPITGHSQFESRALAGQDQIQVQLDTQVGFEQRLGQLKLVGPGAKVKFALDGEGAPTQLIYNSRRLRQGTMVAIISPEQAKQKLLQQLMQVLQGLKSQNQISDVQLSSELVYYAPPLSQKVEAIYPHYEIRASFISGGQRVQSRAVLVPAVSKGLSVSIESQPKGADQLIRARIQGGRPPYRVSLNPLNPMSADPAQAQEARDYTREVGHWMGLMVEPNTAELEVRLQDVLMTGYLTGASTQTTLGEIIVVKQLDATVNVLDADGLVAQQRLSCGISKDQRMQCAGIADKQVAFDSGAAVPGATVTASNGFSTQMAGRDDVGSEWVGLSQGLAGSRDNAAGFVNRFADRGLHVSFNYGDYAAWEEDFKQVPLGGTDNTYADNVDMAFYTGHANGNLFTFPGSHDDGQLTYSDASFGENDLEWMMIASCGPMQRYEGGVHLFDRWGSSFKGLHLLTGYATVSYDNRIEGDRLGRYLLQERLSVSQAWAKMAGEAQPASVSYGYMGVYGAGGVSNWNDHYWGYGTVGPDIRDVRGYWSVTAPS
ncbi:MAG TPA: DUF6345 domain-containing protein [Candidatus Obscuribacterales bacterium]